MTCKTFLSFYIIICLSACFYCYDNSKNLREDLAKLFEGTLNFSKSSLPYYKKDLVDHTPKNHSVYDFIVIGAGSAGATIASRLSEVKGFTVLLIEAGSYEYPIMDIPSIASYLQLSNQVNWNFETETSFAFCQGMVGSKCKMPRGKVLGGNSVFNFMLATRGNKNDFDNWAAETGDISWSYDKMLKYFKKLENFRVKDVKYDSNFHGFDGPLELTTNPYQTELSKAFIEAGKDFGFPTKVDYNGDEQVGFSYFQSNIKNGKRWSTNRAYLHSAKSRKNLFLTINSHVIKILINPVSKLAEGVQFSKFGKLYEVRAKKEIILSAGAIGSPQILMLSGVGPADHLRNLGIDVIQNAPVGENFMDHVGYGGLTFKVNDSSTFSGLNLLDPRNPALDQYVTNRTGPFSLNAGFEALTYVNVDTLDPMDENPNIELLWGIADGIKSPSYGRLMGIRPDYQREMEKDVFNHSAWTAVLMLMHPKSRGKILLRSNDPYDKPLIYPNYLDDPEDVKTLIKGIRFVLKLSETDPLKKIGSELYKVYAPCEHYLYKSDEYWECVLRTYTSSIWHLSGTCRMGKEGRKTSVVNSDLQVIGIKGLRVADASIMPKIVSAHPNIPIIAIGEKLADLIKTRWF